MARSEVVVVEQILEGLVALGLFELHSLHVHIVAIVLVVPGSEVGLDPGLLPVEFAQFDVVELLPELLSLELVALGLALLLERVEVHGDPHDLAEL